MRQRGMQRFQPEVELLLSCVREQTLDNPGGHNTTFAADDLDWETVVDLARRHRLQPFVHRSLTENEIPIPSDVRADLEKASEALVRRNLYMVSELVDVLDRLEEEDVRVLTYKGPSLAELAYRDITLREFVDLDLLVPKEDFSEAIDILCAGNYVVEESFPAFGEKTLQEQDTGLPIDLHYRVTPARYPFTFPFDRLWERRAEVSLWGETVQTFSPSDLLPVVAVHGTRHFWVQLEWLVSFTALIQHESVNWARVLRRSKQTGCDRMVLLGLQLSQELLGLSLPERISTIIDDERIVQLLSERVISRTVYQNVDYSKDNRPLHYERYLAQLILMRGLRARGEYGARIGSSLIANRLSSVDFVLS